MTDKQKLLESVSIKISSNGCVSVRGIDILRSRKGQEQLAALKRYLDKRKNCANSNIDVN